MNKLLLILMMLISAQSHAMEVEGVKVDDNLRLDTHQLVLNGAGVRTKFFFKVYVAGLYLGEKKQSAVAVLDDAGAKRMLFHMLRDVSGKQMIDAINEAIPTNHNAEEMKVLESRLNEFTKIFASVHELKKDQEVTFDYVPSVGTRVFIAGLEKGRIDGADFFSAILKVWLGEKPVQTDLKQSLLGGK